MQVSFNQQNTSHLLHSTTHLLYRPDQGADPQEAFAKDGVVVWNCSPQRCPVDVTGTALGDLLPVCPNGACRVFVIVPVSVQWQPADLSTLATKRRCCCVSQPEADKQTDSRPAAVAMRVCVCGGGARVSQAAVSTRGSIMNIHDTPIPSNLQLDTYTDTHTLWMMVTMVIRAHLSLLHLVRTLSLPLKLHYFSLSVLVRASHQPVEIHTLMFYSGQFSVTWRVWILWGFFLGLSVRLHTGWCSTLWLVKITLRPTLHHHHVNMVLFPFVVVHIPLCCWR